MRLLPKADRRVRLGHSWVFSNEVDTAKTPLTAFEPGDFATIQDARGQPVGIGYVNPNALICARILTSNVRAVIDERWFAQRIRRALELRERIYTSPHYRLIFGESDGIPGLVADRFGEVIVAQLNTAGIYRRRDTIVHALREVTGVQNLLLTSAGSIRALEGIPASQEEIGDLPDDLRVEENGIHLVAPLRGGQKTGFFFDQRDNRARLARYVPGRDVLDVYSYVGAWGIVAAKFGAASVTCVDSSATALEYAARNAEINRCNMRLEEGNAVEVMERYYAQQQRFDVVIVDPPAFVKRRKDVAVGERLYERVNRAAIRLVRENGTLVACSCSHHMSLEHLQRAILRAAKAEGRRPQILEQHRQPPDHPVQPAMPETEYLKAFFVRL
ncbi:MAG: class I SAM-dependent rRNA methyltransferase [Candidatus Eremiobacteraeota bacterium]|nr:class I SAM-dependent rRNA methyltransferase [Candidatus Eremiobacteraeota bacterium]